MIQESDLLRYLEGECTPAEAAAIQAWLMAEPQRSAQLEELRVVWRHTGAAAHRWDIARARERLRCARGLDAAPAALSARRSRWLEGRVWRVVAVVIIALAASTFYLASRRSIRTYETERGQLMTVSLADGSRVVLSPASRLLVPARFGARDRVVELEGEAYFIVEHDATRPLLVRTAYGAAEDLGTEFDVRAFPQDSALQVVVTSGHVLLHGPPRANTRSRALRPHDRGVVEADGSLAVVNGVELDRYVAWTEGRLVYDQTPVAEIVTDLERWYGLEIEMEGQAFADERVTISFAQQTADQALSELATVLQARHARDAGRVRLVRDHSPH